METQHDLRRHDLRRTDRQVCDHNITVMWRGPRGEDKFVLAKALDICESGLRLQMPEGLPRQTSLGLSAAKLGLTGNASVRHCTQMSVSKFTVGIEFTAGLRWTPKI
jgi:hypothetical protein